MAVIFMDGFDWYQGGVTSTAFVGDMGKRWTAVTGSGANCSINASYARNASGQGMRVNSGNNGSFYKSFGTNYVSGVVGFAIYGVNTWASRTIFTILDGTTEQCSIRTNASSVLTVTQAGTVRATGTTVLSTSTWYYIEFKFTINGSTGVAEVQLNGASEIASTGSLDLTGTAANQWNGVQFIYSSTTDWYVDDIYVLDTVSGSNTNFLGPIQVVVLNPAANGNSASWTPNGGTNMGCVSDTYQNGNNTFVQSSTANQIDTYVMQDLPSASGSVYALAQYIVATQDGGSVRSIAPVYRIGGSDYVGTAVNTSTSYQFFAEIRDTQPVGGTPAWDISTVNALESGFKLIS